MQRLRVGVDLILEIQDGHRPVTGPLIPAQKETLARYSKARTADGGEELTISIRVVKYWIKIPASYLFVYNHL